MPAKVLVYIALFDRMKSIKNHRRGGIEYDVIDITENAQARDYVMSLGYLQAPVVVAGENHWSGFRPDEIKKLTPAA
jgi:glutaredoxin-like protein NrdH